MILADTSIWVDYFRFGDHEMRNLLNQGQVVIHPFIIAELALGSIKHRLRTLSLLDLLPRVRVAQLDEVRSMVEARGLHGLGIGLIDAYLLASVFIDPPTLLWTRDKSLRKVAHALAVDASLP